MSANDVLDQADALMRRHRSFVARAAGAAAVTPPADVAPDDAGIPVLTEVVPAAAEAPAPQNVAAMLDALRDEVDSAAASWLAEALPAAVANAGQQILAELDLQARDALLPRLHEIIARHRDKTGQDQSL